MSYWIGQMSGTSADALDLVALSSEDLSYNHHCDYPYSAPFKKQLHSIIEKDQPIEAAIVDQKLTRFMIESLLDFQQKLDAPIKGIGLHGHTLKHEPHQGTTSTLMNPQQIADYFKVPVVAEMRLSDVKAGGQGAPLAPLFHQHCFSESGQAIGILNLGGMANLTILEGTDRVMGFDIGPANTLMDGLCRVHFNCDFDADGRIAQTGAINQALLAVMFKDSYFSQPAPKSTGREYFNASWLAQQLTQSPEPNPNNVMATLHELLVQSIRNSVEALTPTLDRLIICGGGVNNTYLMHQLNKHLLMDIRCSEKHGWPSSALEGATWAWLASQRIAGVLQNTTTITGAQYPILLGTIYTPNGHEISNF